ncbi:MAG TPA: nucleotidyltransferase domain-containing protein [Acidimicrobiales bacterium]|nr:nucleotidyltransferase domain-containing protein [Acidimicrobiales bacterium]
MRIDAATIIERRKREQRDLLGRAERFAAQLAPALGVRAVIVFGSVARGDFNVWSDIDVLVVAEHLPDRLSDRLDALGDLPSLVQPVAWTPEELRRQLARANPIAREALDRGVWLVGSGSEVR